METQNASDSGDELELRLYFGFCPRYSGDWDFRGVGKSRVI